MSGRRDPHPLMAPVFASRQLLGFVCHRASVRLHEAAVRLLDPDCGGSDPWGRDEVWDWFHMGPTFQHLAEDDTGYGPPIALVDVAPRLAATIERARGAVQHTTWIAGIVALGRRVEREERDG